MAVNRVAGLVLPLVSKPLLDKVLSPLHPQPGLLPGIIAAVLAATVIQAITSYSLTQLLSIAGQKLIAEMRREVQRHVGLLSVAYYDENRAGTLVARIMTDVEGVRNLVGTGLVQFVGGMLTAVLVFFFLLYRSVTVTLTVFAVVGTFVFVLQYGFKSDSADLPRARKDQRRGDGAAHGVAGRRARGQGVSRRGARAQSLFCRRGPAAR